MTLDLQDVQLVFSKKKEQANSLAVKINDTRNLMKQKGEAYEEIKGRVLELRGQFDTVRDILDEEAALKNKNKLNMLQGQQAWFQLQTL